MIASAFRIKQISPWRNFNFDNPKLYNDNITIIKRIESDLALRGYLHRPVIYFDKGSIVRGLGIEEYKRLVSIALRFGAKIVDDYVPYSASSSSNSSTSRVTHIVAYDPEEHDSQIQIEEEKERERRKGAGEIEYYDEEEGLGISVPSETSEKKFLRTLAVVDDNTPNEMGGGAGVTKMALVHWWYHPTSYDEWLPASEVSPVVGEDDEEQNIGIIPGDGPCVVGCKFIRDVERFNEWGVEADYAVMDYERKVDCLMKPLSATTTETTNNQKKMNKKRSNKSKLSSSCVIEKVESQEGMVDMNNKDDDDDDDENPAKRQKLLLVGQDGNGDVDSTLITLPPSTSMKMKSLVSQNKTIPAPSIVATTVMSNHRAVSERRTPSSIGGGGGGGGMNPRGILTGYRGVRGELVRRTVHDGALRVEDNAYMIIKDAMADYIHGGEKVSNVTISTMSSTTIAAPLPTLAAKSEWRKLLPATGFIRPSVDESLGSMIVTELTLQEGKQQYVDVNGFTDIRMVTHTLAMNRTVPILIPPENVAAASVADVTDEALTMRGGGDGTNEEYGDGGNDDDAQTLREQQEAALMMMAFAAPAPDVAADGDVAMPDSKDVVDAWSIPNTNNYPQSLLMDDNMNVEKEESPEENLHEENAPPPEADAPCDEIPVGQDGVVNTAVDTTNAGEDKAADGLAENVIQVEGILVPSETPQDMHVLSPIADESVPSSTVEGGGEPTTILPDTTTAEVALEVVAGPYAGAIKDVDSISAGNQPSEVIPQAAAAITAAAPTVSSTVVTQIPSDNSLPTMAPATINDASSQLLVASTVASNTMTISASASDPMSLRKVVTLPPNTFLSNSLVQQHLSNVGDSTGGPEQPSWYHPTKPSEYEKRTLPEWFNGSAPHRTESSYINTRENILCLAKHNSQQYITSTAIRRSVVGDAGSLVRLHKFLMDCGLSNFGQIGETAPSDAVLRGVHAVGGALNSSRSNKRKFSSDFNWSMDRIYALEASVVKNTKRVKMEGDHDSIVINWDNVATDVGDGVTALDCQRTFVNPPAEDDKITMSSTSTNSVFCQMLDGVHPDVLKAVVQASLQSTNDINEARKSAFIASVASAAVQKGMQAESEIENTLMEIVDQRLQRLENRVALLDDVEALLEAERVSLELERRDMYTTRCRHWFGDGSS